MRVLVSGGTGFIGSRVAAALLAEGQHQVAVVSRRASMPIALAGRVEVRQGDVTRPETLPAAVEGMEVVVHCVQFPNHPVEAPRLGRTYAAVDGQGTANLVAACRAAGVRRVVYFSGAGVRPGRPEPWFRAKEQAEAAIHGSGLEYVILRPSWIYGPGDRSLNTYVAFTRRLPVVPVIGSGTNTVQPLFVEDAAQAAVRAIDLPGPVRETLELGSEQPLTMDEILRTIQRVLGVRRWLVHQPAGLVKLLVAPLALLPAPPMTPGAIDFILMEEPVDPRPAQQRLGVTFRSLEEGLRAYL